MTIFIDRQVRDAVTAELRPELVGQNVTIVYVGTTDPVPIVEYPSGVAIQGSVLTVTAEYRLIAFKTPDGVHAVEVLAADGTRTYLYSEEGTRIAAEQSAASAASSATSAASSASAAAGALTAAEAARIPPGGTTGQALIKASNADRVVTWGTVAGGPGGGTSDHGALEGLEDDDHPQYLDETRGDARYYTKEQTDAAIEEGVTAPPAASTSTPGLARYASTSETQTGEANNRAVTPAGLAALPAVTAGDIPFDEDESVGDVLADVLARLEALETGGPPLSASVLPAISGSPTVGSVLTATSGTWSPTPDSVSYQWLRSGSAISGATSSTYTLVSGDIGTNTISVRVTAVKDGYSNGVATSAPVTVGAAPLPFGVAVITPPETVYSGTTLTFDKADAGTLVAGTDLYVLLYANLSSGGSAWSAVSGSGSWSEVGPAWPGSSAVNRVLTVLKHTVTNPADEPTAWQFTRTGVNGRNAGALIVAQSSELDAMVSSYNGGSVTNGRSIAALTAEGAGVQVMWATKEGSATSAQNPTTAPAGFTQRINTAINDGTGESAQTFFYVYTRTVAEGEQAAATIAWSAGATNPNAQSFILMDAS